MEKRLKIDKPLVFKRLISNYSLATLTLIFGALSVFPLIIFAKAGTLIWLGAVMSAAIAATGAYVWHSVTADAIVDSQGLETRSRLGNKRVLWKDAKSITYTSFRGSYNYTVYGTKGDVSFTDGLQNASYLYTICSTVINNQPERDGYIHLPAAPYEDILSSGPLVTTFITAGIPIMLGATIFCTNLESLNLAFNTPIVPISKASDFVDKKQNIIMQGALHSDQELSSRDGKNKYAMQAIRITICHGSDNHSSYCLWAPERAWLQDGKGEIEVTINDPDNNSLPLDWESALKKDWKNTGLRNLMAETFESSIDKKMAEWKDSLDVTLRSVPQDGKVLVAGRVVKCEDHLRLDPAGDASWIHMDSLEAIKKEALTWSSAGAALLLWGLIGVVAGFRQLAEFKKIGKIV